MSFLNPGDAVVSKDAFAVSRFLGAFCEEAKRVMSDVESRAATEEDRVVLQNLKDRYAYVVDKDALAREYDQYKLAYEQQIQDDYARATDGQACVYGIKIRGAYETLAEARARANQLKTKDPCFDVYVGEMGCWCPWSPNPDDIADAEYGETQLNTLMKKYKENMALKDQVYEDRKSSLLTVEEVGGTEASLESTGYEPGVPATESEVLSAMS